MACFPRGAPRRRLSRSFTARPGRRCCFPISRNALRRWARRGSAIRPSNSRRSSRPKSKNGRKALRRPGLGRDETVGFALAALREFAGPPQAALLGRPERLDVLNAALINAISSNILDFDDTHLRTVINPTGPG